MGNCLEVPQDRQDAYVDRNDPRSAPQRQQSIALRNGPGSQGGPLTARRQQSNGLHRETAMNGGGMSFRSQPQSSNGELARGE